MIEELRRREVQALHAGISNRSWHEVEVAANALRDKLDRALSASPQSTEGLREALAIRLAHHVILGLLDRKGGGVVVEQLTGAFFDQVVTAALSASSVDAPPTEREKIVEDRNATIFAMNRRLRADRRFEKWTDAPLLGFAVLMYDLARGGDANG